MALSETAALYDRIASGYQRWWAPVIEPAALRLLDLVAPIVAEQPEAVVVDVGAGTGTLARAAVSRWPRVRLIAVDPSDGMLTVGRTLAATSLPPAAQARLQWASGTAEQLPLETASADVVVSSFTLQYLHRRVVALREAHRVLRPGGAIAVVTWLANDWPFEPWRVWRALLDELQIEPPASPETGLFRSLPSAAALLRRAGFGRVHARTGTVEYQWTLDAFLHCSLESEDRELFDSLDRETRGCLERAWRERLVPLTKADFHYRDAVAYVDGLRTDPGRKA